MPTPTATSTPTPTGRWPSAIAIRWFARSTTTSRSTASCVEQLAGDELSGFVAGQRRHARNDLVARSHPLFAQRARWHGRERRQRRRSARRSLHGARIDRADRRLIAVGHDDPMRQVPRPQVRADLAARLLPTAVRFLPGLQHPTLAQAERARRVSPICPARWRAGRRKGRQIDAEHRRSSRPSTPPGSARIGRRARCCSKTRFDEAGPPLADNWSTTAPGDDAPGGEPPVKLDSAEAPAGQQQQAGLAILESGAAGDRWLSTKQSFDWTPEKKGEWIQVTFDLLDNKAGPRRTAGRAHRLLHRPARLRRQ